jgi:hypothetical protein
MGAVLEENDARPSAKKKEENRTRSVIDWHGSVYPMNADWIRNHCVFMLFRPIDRLETVPLSHRFLLFMEARGHEVGSLFH